MPGKTVYSTRSRQPEARRGWYIVTARQTHLLLPSSVHWDFDVFSRLLAYIFEIPLDRMLGRSVSFLLLAAFYFCILAHRCSYSLS